MQTQADPATVFAFATDIERRPRWQRHLSKAERLEAGPLGLGSTFREKGRGGSMILKITGFEPARHLRYETVESRTAHVELDWAFEPTAAGTRIEIRMHFEPRGLLRLAWPVAGPLLVLPQVEKDMARLSRMLEALA